MIQLQNGNFTEIADPETIISDFMDMADRGNYPKAVFFGTPRELEEIKHQASTEERLEKIEKKLEDLKLNPLTSELILIPTNSEIETFGGLNG